MSTERRSSTATPAEPAVPAWDFGGMFACVESVSASCVVVPIWCGAFRRLLSFRPLNCRSHVVSSAGRFPYGVTRMLHAQPVGMPSTTGRRVLLGRAPDHRIPLRG